MNHMQAIKWIVIFFLSVLGLVFATQFFINAMAYLTLAVWFIAGVAVTGAIGVGTYQVMRLTGKVKGPQLLIGKADYKVFDITRKQVYAFRAEPTIADLAKMRDELHLAQLELQGEVFPLRNEEAVEIIEDSGKESIKVRVKSKEKGLKQEGWICRSSLVKV